MRRLITILAAGLLLAAQITPALAQRIIVPPASASGANLNLNNTYETCGQGDDGLGVLVTSGGAGNTYGSYTNLCTLSAAAKGGFLFVGPGNNSNTRLLITARQNGATDFLVNQYVELGTSSVVRIPVPAAIAAGALDVKISGDAASRTARISFEAALSNSQSAPLFALCEGINSDTATTRPTGDVTLATSGTTFDTIVASTANTYGAFVVGGAASGSTPATSQSAKYSLATGAAASETIIFDQLLWTVAATTPFNGRSPANFDKSVASGSRLSMRGLAVVGTDVVRFGITGCR